MSVSLTCRIKPYIQPFERELALRELEALTGGTPRPVGTVECDVTTFRVKSNLDAKSLSEKLAFWEAVCQDKTLTTKQSLRESTANVVRNGIPLNELMSKLPFTADVPLPNRRCLRYGAHGLHEYRGKFFPQLVRSFMNIAEVPEDGLIADPFSGSGTTAVEAILSNRRAIGLDMNPLSVFMGQTKCDLLSLRLADLERSYLAVRAGLLDTRPRNRFPSWLSTLPDVDREYLEQWFDAAILKELDHIAGCITNLTSGVTRDFMFLSLSNILRTVSWQKEDDLRVRRELKPIDEVDAIREFLEELGRSTRLVLAFLRQERSPIPSKAIIQQGDSKQLLKYWQQWVGKVDAVITSPPYATALPYLDTDRLSLCFLGLLTRSAHRNYDRDMIGNREITDKTRSTFWNDFAQNKKHLPRSVSDLITRIYDLNEPTNVGFRRRNLPSLLYKYFADMKSVFDGTQQLLKRGGSAFVVVGSNHTVAGGNRVEIKTCRLLTEVAESAGLKLMRRIDMEMLVSRDIFKKNASNSECILHFRASGQ